ncbi:phospholipase D family protein [Undibacterium danionis]|uniref:Phospholipase D family protein n=1 Tax=Undibacterium danionis TaxID=1812100 RepID=A0ABV6IBT0_9BURK
MARASITRRLLRRMSFSDVKFINAYYELQARKSKEQMIGQVVYQVGTNLQLLVSPKGPFLLTRWNEIVADFGGAPRNSFESLCDEIEASLDPVFDELDGDISIVDLREDKTAIRTLSEKLGIEQSVLTKTLGETHGRMLLGTFVRQMRDREVNRIHMPHVKSTSISIASTKIEADSIEKMSLPWMKQKMVDANEIGIIAGFYDVKFLRYILEHSKATNIRLIFNGLGGRRCFEQCEELNKLKKTLSCVGQNVEIRLAFAPGLFHSKLFLIAENGVTQALIGSANATCAAFEKNEEILVCLPEAQALTGYFSLAWEEAKPIEDLQQQTAYSLINFFRTGILYFKPVATLSTTLNPFHDLLKLMTNDERALLGGIKLPYADQATGIGPFNLKQAVQGDESPNDWDENLEEANVEFEKTTRASIKPWSVETCFGYWVPSQVDTEWRSRLEKTGSYKHQKLRAFYKDLVDTDEDLLLSKYQAYLDEVRNTLSEKIPKLKTYLNSLKRDPFDESIFTKFLARVRGYLEDETRVKRLAEPFISGKIPEIWDDTQAYEDFRTSFYDSLDQAARLMSNKPKVMKIILGKLQVTDPINDPDEWTKIFEEFLENNGWENDDWLD